MYRDLDNKGLLLKEEKIGLEVIETSVDLSLDTSR